MLFIPGQFPAPQNNNMKFQLAANYDEHKPTTNEFHFPNQFDLDFLSLYE